MKYDLSFVNDPEWMKSRDALWLSIESRLALNNNKKELEAIKSYFFTGKLNTYVMKYPSAIIQYFPSSNLDAIKNCFSLIDERVCDESQFGSIIALFSLNIENWPGLSYERRGELFDFFFGKVFDPSRKMPTLIGREEKPRALWVRKTWFFLVLGQRLVLAMKVPDKRVAKENIPAYRFWLAKIDFFVSMIEYIDPIFFDQTFLSSATTLIEQHEMEKKTLDREHWGAIYAMIGRLIQQSLHYCETLSPLNCERKKVAEKLIYYLDSVGADSPLSNIRTYVDRHGTWKMSQCFCFSFVVKDQDIDKWINICETLEYECQEAYFQKAIGIFGESAKRAVDAIVENSGLGMECFLFEEWEHDNNNFSISLDMPPEIVETFIRLFEACGVADFEVSTDY